METLIQAGCFRRALAEAEAALRRRPDHAQAMHVKALSLEALGWHREACASFSQAAQLCDKTSKSFQLECRRGVRQSLIFVDQQDWGKYDWNIFFGKDLAALVSGTVEAGGSRPNSAGAHTARVPLLRAVPYSKAVEVQLRQDRGRALVSRQPAKTGQLLFVSKAFVLGRPDELEQKAIQRLQSCGQAEYDSFFKLFNGVNFEEPVPEALTEGRPLDLALAPEPEEPRVVDAELVRRVLRFGVKRREALDKLGVPCKAGGGEEGLWWLAAFMNHSCRANVTVTFVGDLLVCRAARPLEAGEELLTSYTRPDRPLAARQKILNQRFGLQCRCHRCILEAKLLPEEQATRFVQERVGPLTKTPKETDRKAMHAWAEGWSQLGRDIEHWLLVNTKEHYTSLDAEPSLREACDELFEQCYCAELEEKREKRLAEELRACDKIDQQRKQLGMDVISHEFGRSELYSEQIVRLLAGSFAQVYLHAARLWKQFGVPENCSFASEKLCGFWEELAPLSPQHCHWARESASQACLASQLRQKQALLQCRTRPGLALPPLSVRAVEAAIYAKRCHARTYGKEVWEMQLCFMGWPQQLRACCADQSKSSAYAIVPDRPWRGEVQDRPRQAFLPTAKSLGITDTCSSQQQPEAAVPRPTPSPPKEPKTARPKSARRQEPTTPKDTMEEPKTPKVSKAGDRAQLWNVKTKNPLSKKMPLSSCQVVEEVEDPVDELKAGLKSLFAKRGLTFQDLPPLDD